MEAEQLKHRTHRRLMAILSKQGYSTEQRHELVEGFTGGRTHSTTQLYTSEMQQLCEFLNRKSNDAQRELMLRNKRATILKIATSCDIHDPEDWSKFNRFMINRSVLHKPLKDYDLLELNALIAQFRKLEENYHASAEKFGNKAYWHRGAKLASLN